LPFLLNFFEKSVSSNYIIPKFGFGRKNCPQRVRTLILRKITHFRTNFFQTYLIRKIVTFPTHNNKRLNISPRKKESAVDIEPCLFPER